MGQRDMPAYAVLETFRLLENLLQHEMLVTTFLYLSEFQIHGLYLWRQTVVED